MTTGQGWQRAYGGRTNSHSPRVRERNIRWVAMHTVSIVLPQSDRRLFSAELLVCKNHKSRQARRRVVRASDWRLVVRCDVSSCGIRHLGHPFVVPFGPTWLGLRGEVVAHMMMHRQPGDLSDSPRSRPLPPLTALAFSSSSTNSCGLTVM